MLAVLRGLAELGGQVATRHALPGYGDRSRPHGNVVYALLREGYIAAPADGGAGLQISAAGIDLLVMHTARAWWQLLPGPVYDAARREHLRRFPPPDMPDRPGNRPHTMVELVRDLTLVWYTAGRGNYTVASAADNGMALHREIVRRLDAAKQYLGTEASRINDILDGRDTTR